MIVRSKKLIMRMCLMICLSVFLSACGGEEEALKLQNVELTTQVAELQSALAKSQLSVLEYKKKAEEATKPSVRENELQALLQQKNRLLAQKSQQISRLKSGSNK